MPGDIMSARRSSLAHLVAGATEVARGDLHAAAARHAAQLSLGGGNDDIQLAWQQGMAGELALSRGQLAQAESAFRAAEYRTPPSFSLHVVLVSLANNLPYRDGLARATAARGGSREAIEIYRRLNQPDIASRWTAVLEPRFVLAAARLADRAGDRATAKAEYARFLELWKDADEGAPELSEARRYLDR
jgi:tetratricopeptide (TPR) repeat protein